VLKVIVDADLNGRDAVLKNKLMAIDTKFLAPGPLNRAAVLKNICDTYIRISKDPTAVNPIAETIASKEETIVVSRRRPEFYQHPKANPDPSPRFSLVSNFNWKNVYERTRNHTCFT
jgi:hypothetical protein